MIDFFFVFSKRLDPFTVISLLIFFDLIVKSNNACMFQIFFSSSKNVITKNWILWINIFYFFLKTSSLKKFFCWDDKINPCKQLHYFTDELLHVAGHFLGGTPVMYVKVFKVGRCVKVCYGFLKVVILCQILDQSRDKKKIREINFHKKVFFFSQDEVSAIDASTRIFTRDTYYII